jgi:DNA polymerase I-like protein with 3'-5' exonuclease and polymerase domains
MKVCVLDIEGNGLGELVLDSKGKPYTEATRVLCAATKVNDEEPILWLEHQMKDLVKYLSEMPVIIGHNIWGYDFPVMRRLYGMARPKCIVDTLVISKLMYPDINNHPIGDNSLESWGKHLKFPKMDYTGGWQQYSDEMGTYCLQDARLGMAIYQAQKSFITKNKELVRFESSVSEVLMEQVEHGFNYDRDAGDRLYQTLMLEKLGIEDEMRQIFPDRIIIRNSEKTGKRLKDKIETFNPGSRQQIAARLTDKYGWEPPLTDKGNPKVDEAVLATLEYPEAKKLTEYFNTVKLMGMVEDWNTRANSSRDTRIHGNINAQGAATGRCTHSQPNIAQVSGDHRARELWISDPGDVVVGADLSGLELRMLAHFMAKYDNGEYAKVLLTGDIHTHNQHAAGLSSRSLAKSFIYAYLYGAGDKKIALVCDCSVPDARKLRERFQKEIPALTKVQDVVRFETIKTGKVRLPDGRQVPVRSEHAALNTLLQGSGAIVSKYWMVEASKEAMRHRAHQLAYIHDELQYSCPKSCADDFGKAVTAAATKAGELLNLNIRIDAEYRVGNTWAETH